MALFARTIGTYGVPLVGFTLLNSFSTLFAVCENHEESATATVDHEEARNELECC